MRANKFSSYPRLRREYQNAQEMADVILKSPGYIYARMNGSRNFTHREKIAFLKDLGRSEADLSLYFPE